MNVRVPAVSAMSVPPAGRVTRRPTHTFNIRHTPFDIQPFLLAPVIPGETMQNALIQARAVSSPVRNRLIGWWLEYYVFYVKHRDLTDREEFVEMMLNPNWTMADVDSDTASTFTYFYGHTINWTQLCLQRVVEEYFRDEGELWNAAVNGTSSLPKAAINGNSWIDSMYFSSDMPDDDLPTESTDLPLSEMDQAYRHWEFMRANALTTMSYEDFLRTYGVRPDREQHKPELIRYLREWQYPSNTIDPEDGSATTALSWSIAERADKDRFFKEPGFIFGVTVARPKVYLSRQEGSAAGMMNNAFSWLPAILGADPYTSLREFTGGNAAGRGPIQTTGSEAYWVDVRDLLIYGDQFLNYARTLDAADNPNLVQLPDPGTLQRRYASDGDIADIFTGDSGGYVEQDGIVNLNILGTQKDYTGSLNTAITA